MRSAGVYAHDVGSAAVLQQMSATAVGAAMKLFSSVSELVLFLWACFAVGWWLLYLGGLLWDLLVAGVR